MGKPVTKYCVISRYSRCIISRCCAIVFMGAAILEQQEQQEKVAYKESFPTTITAVYIIKLMENVIIFTFSLWNWSL